MARSDGDVLDLLSRARKAWNDGCNCQVCYLIERYERGQMGWNAVQHLARVWIDENGPIHTGTRHWSRRTSRMWLD